MCILGVFCGLIVSYSAVVAIKTKQEAEMVLSDLDHKLRKIKYRFHAIGNHLVLCFI